MRFDQALQSCDRSRKKNILLALVLLLIALLPRLYWLLTTYDYDPDAWLRIINMMTQLYNPIWPVGYFYMVKPFYILFGQPEWILRVFSLLTGIGTVGLVYAFIKTITRQTRAAAWSALFVALLPIHISISTQSLAEAPFLFFIFAWLLAYVKSRYIWSALALALAALIRVEAWPLIGVILLLLLINQLRSADSRSVRPIFIFSTISLLPPLAYLAINKIIGGTSRLVWNLNLENPKQLVQNSPPGGLIYAIKSTGMVILDGFSNLPHTRETILGVMGFFLNSYNPTRFLGLSYALFALVFGLAVFGIIKGVRSGWKSIGLFVIIPMVFAVILVGAILILATYPKSVLSVLEHVFIVTLAGVGLANLADTRARYALGGVIIAGLLVLGLTSRFSGPAELLQAANVVRSLAGPGTMESRFYGAIGLRGPEFQTLFYKRLAGPYAPLLEKAAPAPSGPQVFVLNGDNRELDYYQDNLIQAYAGLAYDQFHSPAWEEDRADLLNQPDIVVLAKNSLELREKGSSDALRNLLSTRGWSLVFENSSFDVWRLKHREGDAATR